MLKRILGIVGWIGTALVFAAVAVRFLRPEWDQYAVYAAWGGLACALPLCPSLVGMDAPGPCAGQPRRWLVLLSWRLPSASFESPLTVRVEALVGAPGVAVWLSIIKRSSWVRGLHA